MVYNLKFTARPHGGADQRYAAAHAKIRRPGLLQRPCLICAAYDRAASPYPQQDHSLQHLQQDTSEYPHYFVSGGGGYRAHGKVGLIGLHRAADILLVLSRSQREAEPEPPRPARITFARLHDRHSQQCHPLCVVCWSKRLCVLLHLYLPRGPIARAFMNQ